MALKIQIKVLFSQPIVEGHTTLKTQYDACWLCITERFVLVEAILLSGK